MKEITKLTYRSNERKINEDDDRMRIIIDMSRYEYERLKHLWNEIDDSGRIKDIKTECSIKVMQDD
jgi:hypothetical protein